MIYDIFYLMNFTGYPAGFRTTKLIKGEVKE